ncbi:MLP-like protein 43 [Momordica charantia]|uniref:MLP-like protein 43 n=1 Tax=Momordica charantia TaxID=3673 RepID=A0A6J1C8Q0_MOMCH|nr:MLP-like protein 43 [Momordica charantia]
MDLCGKLETDVQIKSPAKKFHEILHLSPHHMPNVTKNPKHHIRGCELHEGEWGKVGSVLNWTYFHGGKECVAKELIEAIDEEKNLITFKVTDGDILEHYKSFKFTMQCIPKKKGSVVHWTLEYEKQHDKIPESHESLLEFCVDVSKDLDAHLMEMDNN